MNWENLTSYKPLKKEELKNAFKDFTKLVAKELKPFGFIKRERKLYRLTNDLIEVIDFDYRGSWSGQTEHFETKIGLVPICWYELDKKHNTVGCKEIKSIVPYIQNHYRLTKEYDLLAKYFVNIIKKHVIPYFEKYNSTKKVVHNAQQFIHPTIEKLIPNEIDGMSYLIIFSELRQNVDNFSSKYIKAHVEFYSQLNPNSKKAQEWLKLYQLVQNREWEKINKWLNENEHRELNRLKLKKASS